jgi:hypothetical protein
MAIWEARQTPRVPGFVAMSIVEASPDRPPPSLFTTVLTSRFGRLVRRPPPFHAAGSTVNTALIPRPTTRPVLSATTSKNAARLCGQVVARRARLTPPEPEQKQGPRGAGGPRSLPRQVEPQLPPHWDNSSIASLYLSDWPVNFTPRRWPNSPLAGGCGRVGQSSPAGALALRRDRRHQERELRSMSIPLRRSGSAAPGRSRNSGRACFEKCPRGH